MKATILERERAANDRAEHSARDEHLAGSRERANARGDVDGHAADILADQLTLTCVHANAHLDPELACGGGDLKGTAQSPRWRPLEGHEEAVTDGLHLMAAKAGELLTHQRIVVGEQIAPATVAQPGGARCRIHDVRKHHR